MKRTFLLPCLLLVAVGALVLLLRRDDALDVGPPESDIAAQHDPSSSRAPSELAPRGKPEVHDARPVVPASTPTPDRPAVLVGWLTDSQGRPVRGARVRVGEGKDVLTDEQGRFGLESSASADTPLIVETDSGRRLHTTVGALATGATLVLPPTETLSGVVVDADGGTPLAGVSVTLDRASPPRMVSTPSVRTPPDGAFSFDVAAGYPYVLRVGTSFRVGRPSAADLYIPTIVDDLVPGTAPIVVRLVKGLSISGRIEDPAGEKFVGALMVNAFARTPTGDIDFTRRRALRLDDGDFSFAGLAPGRYDLHFRPMISPDAADTPAAQVGDTLVRDVQAGVVGMVVRLARGSFLRGRLVDETGALVLGRGNVSAVREEERDRNVAVAGYALGDGTFAVGPLDEGIRYRVTAEGFVGHRLARVEGVVVQAEGIEIVLPTGRRIQGRVIDERGRSVREGVPVGWVAEGDGARADGTWAQTVTGPDGVFAVDGLLPLRFTGEAGGGTSAYVGVVVTGIEPGGDAVALKVTEGVALSGRLVDEAGEPVAATVQADDGVRRAANRPYVQVGLDGRFVFRGLSPGPVRFTVRRGESWVAVGEARAPATDVTLVVPSK